ncbi:hypothetical protein EYF80_009250 [Liparis tanakae]|uniref:Uncharacterized protein n=1 Tax=Liparis tanakae TaxID=230148 RepID=A0A4Z2IRN4_9TELE|nr:hypothetical protein EYF80_009250 [Liparis tanakae]
MSPVSLLISSHLSGSLLISYLPQRAELHLQTLVKFVKHKTTLASGLRRTSGTTDSGTTIVMGSSLKRGASFSFMTITTTVALLTGRNDPLLVPRGGSRSGTNGITYASGNSCGCCSLLNTTHTEQAGAKQHQLTERQKRTTESSQVTLIKVFGLD